MQWLVVEDKNIDSESVKLKFWASFPNWKLWTKFGTRYLQQLDYFCKFVVHILWSFLPMSLIFDSMLGVLWGKRLSGESEL